MSKLPCILLGSNNVSWLGFLCSTGKNLVRVRIQLPLIIPGCFGYFSLPQTRKVAESIRCRSIHRPGKTILLLRLKRCSTDTSDVNVVERLANQSNIPVTVLLSVAKFSTAVTSVVPVENLSNHLHLTHLTNVRRTV